MHVVVWARMSRTATVPSSDLFSHGWSPWSSQLIQQINDEVVESLTVMFFKCYLTKTQIQAADNRQQGFMCQKAQWGQGVVSNMLVFDNN